MSYFVILNMAVNIKDLYGNSGNKLKKIKYSLYLIYLVFFFFFPCDFDFLQPLVSTLVSNH